MDAHVAGIPGQLHPAAVGRMSQMSIEHWDKPMKELPDDGQHDAESFHHPTQRCIRILEARSSVHKSCLYRDHFLELFSDSTAGGGGSGLVYLQRRRGYRELRLVKKVYPLDDHLL